MSFTAQELRLRTHGRRDGLYLMILGTLVFLLFGIAFESSSSVAMVDFGVIYFPARTLLHHGDPYNQVEVLRTFDAEQADRIWSIPRERDFMTRFGYPPPTLPVAAPVAALPWRAAHLLWMTLTAASFIFAAFLMWNLGADYAPVLSGALIGFLLANCQAMMVLGNAAGIAVSLCVVAVWCFLRDRHIVAGVICLALSLTLKPHNAWLVWLYFLLAGGIYRKRAFQTLAAVAAIGAPAVLWVWSVAPGWFSEMRSNLAWFAGPGGPCDPSPVSGGSHGMDMLVNLQAIFSVFRNDPRFYQLATDLVFVPLLFLWVYFTLRARRSPRNAWLALAAVAPLSVAPFYHHVHDAKLVLLAVPACVMLLAEGKRMGRFALAVTTLAFICTGDLVWTVLYVFMRLLPAPNTQLGAHMLIAAQIFPAPLAVFLLGVFYLCVFGSQVRAEKLQPQATPVPQPVT
jgi:hypothetical protein